MNTLYLSSKAYHQEIMESGLLKSDRNLLVELFNSFLSKEIPPAITRSAFKSFTSRMPEIFFDKEKITIKFTNTDRPRISINYPSINHKDIFLDHNKRGNKILKLRRQSHRRIQSNSYMR